MACVCDSLCHIGVSMCFGHPSQFLTYFSWESLPRHSNWTVEIQNCMTRVVKIWIQPFDSQSLHGAIHFVAFRNCIRSCTYGITFISLHIFHFLLHSDSHTTYMESRLKITYSLFKCTSLGATEFKPILTC